MLLRLENIKKQYANFQLNNISFEIDSGDYFILLGESGAGKSLLLEIIAGLVSYSSGKIFFKDKEIGKNKNCKGEIAMVFQDYAVFPHMSAYKNIEYPLKNKFTVKEKEKLVRDIAKKLDITYLLYRYPSTMSGGELQRVALARTLVMSPALLLLDEPLSSLDNRLKDEFRLLLRKLNREGITIIHVTHDYKEAVSLAKNVGIIHNGEIIQKGSPDVVFDNPASPFVANLTGVKNYFRGRIISENKFKITEGPEIFINDQTKKGEGYLFIRPEKVLVYANKENKKNIFKAKVIDFYPIPGGVEIIADIGIRISSVLTKNNFNKLNIKESEYLYFVLNPDSIGLTYSK